MPGSIRVATFDDVLALEKVVRAAFVGYVPRLRGRLPAPMEADAATLVAERCVYVLAGAGGDLAGMVVLRPWPDHLLVETLAVDPARHGQGFGRRLLLFAEEQARLADLPELRLYTAEVMTEALALYLRCGWVEFWREAPTGIPRVYLRKRLP